MFDFFTFISYLCIIFVIIALIFLYNIKNKKSRIIILCLPEELNKNLLLLNLETKISKYELLYTILDEYFDECFYDYLEDNKYQYPDYFNYEKNFLNEKELIDYIQNYFPINELRELKFIPDNERLERLKKFKNKK